MCVSHATGGWGCGWLYFVFLGRRRYFDVLGILQGLGVNVLLSFLFSFVLFCFSVVVAASIWKFVPEKLFIAKK